jgi:hypothetical protein
MLFVQTHGTERMRAELKFIDCTGISVPLENWRPDDDDNWGLVITIGVAPVGSEGADNFELTVCTPGWLAENRLTSEILSGEQTLFMRSWDYRILRSYLERRIRAPEGKNWNELANKFSRWSGWEFEDYVDFPAPHS